MRISDWSSDVCSSDLMVILLVLSFRDSSSLTSAYGIAVTGAMLIDTVLLTVLIFRLWKWHPFWAGLLLSIFYIVAGAYFAANMKIGRASCWERLCQYV